MFMLPALSFAADVGTKYTLTPPASKSNVGTKPTVTGSSFAPFGACQLDANLDFKGLIFTIIGPCFLNPAYYLILSLSVFWFIYGVFKYMLVEGNDKQQGRDQIFWGLVGIAAMVAVWALVSIITHTFAN